MAIDPFLFFQNRDVKLHATQGKLPLCRHSDHSRDVAGDGYGIALSMGLFVVEIEVGALDIHSADGAERIAEWSTPSGGRTILYRDEMCESEVIAGDGIEVRFRGHVVCPPTAGYVFVDGDAETVARARRLAREGRAVPASVVRRLLAMIEGGA